MFRVILFKQWRLTGGRLRLPGLSIQGGGIVQGGGSGSSIAGTLYFACLQQFIAFAFKCGSGSGFACL